MNRVQAANDTDFRGSSNGEIDAGRFCEKAG
jgi:hypothetical protein